MIAQHEILDRMVECEFAKLGCRFTTRLGDVFEFRRGSFQNGNRRYILGVDQKGNQHCIPRDVIIEFDLVT
ncbi:MAG: hypothetical protein CO029_04525 [Candidatus Magasanikbacteria bacterium CG_4_9_14_0_2_um_filter_41_10]|uniref:Uncharacterized protein n=1 Tax=Candidatus Magasanikbacteria bacterium CG_4_10_14_0_2_um_filter_41_31 TaxID=1974639 RepID=A0A2M7V405_9BACT|nr:MAG: hypothetical protein AUJ37_02500 [Candidatus Magasanikbacteria bacterium CG1_02_41_34]PIZ93251.1 MAG: hypothetical protein COX83_02475 [Candidatus Magasanikbacteria bacterium CG_4_10_14_0_2_um_filter_41_31]PJC53082.1 MAG: hypothetical protein CO029_04525 [Candidatus Magasanikbacteria bacterium CG_4_9_14_0_2_um_filter_41_10]